MGQMEYMKMVAGCAAALSPRPARSVSWSADQRRDAPPCRYGLSWRQVLLDELAKKNAADLKFDVKWIVSGSIFRV